MSATDSSASSAWRSGVIRPMPGWFAVRHANSVSQIGTLLAVGVLEVVLEAVEIAHRDRAVRLLLVAAIDR